MSRGGFCRAAFATRAGKTSVGTSDSERGGTAVPLAADVVRYTHVGPVVLSHDVAYPQTPRLQHADAVDVRLERVVVLGPADARRRLTAGWQAVEGDVVACHRLRRARLFAELRAQHCNIKPTGYLPSRTASPLIDG